MAQSHIDAILTCAICLDRFKQPKQLPCQHTFCLTPCLERLVANSGVCCPACREVHPLPQNGAEGFPSNLMALQLLDVPVQTKSSTDTSCQDNIKRAVSSLLTQAKLEYESIMKKGGLGVKGWELRARDREARSAVRDFINSASQRVKDEALQDFNQNRDVAYTVFEDINEALLKSAGEIYRRSLQEAQNEYRTIMSSHLNETCCHDLKEKHMQTKRDLQNADSNMEGVNKSTQFFRDYMKDKDRMFDDLFTQYDNKNKERARAYTNLVENCLGRYKVEAREQLRRSDMSEWFWMDTKIRNFEKHHVNIRSDHIEQMERQIPPDGCPTCHICTREYTVNFITRIDEFKASLVVEFMERPEEICEEICRRRLQEAQDEYRKIMNSHISDTCCHDLEEKHMQAKRSLQNADSNMEGVNKSSQLFQDYKNERDGKVDNVFAQYDNENDRKLEYRAISYKNLVQNCFGQYKIDAREVLRSSDMEKWFRRDKLECFEKHHVNIRWVHIRAIEQRMPPGECPECHICRSKHTAIFISRMDEYKEELVAEFRRTRTIWGGFDTH